MLAKAGQMIRRRTGVVKRPCPTPVVTGWNGETVTATGTGFRATQGGGHLDEYDGETWTPWGGSYLDWQDTSITLDGPLDVATTAIRIVNDCGHTSNEHEV